MDYKILFVDDEPNYRVNHIKGDHLIFSAHGYNQIDYYLNHTKYKWDLICLDNDMPKLPGIDVSTMFLCERNIPVVIHSMNPIGAKIIKGNLDDYAVPNLILPIGTPDWWEKVLNWLNSIS